MSFQILDSAIPSQRECWLELWRSWPEREPFAHPSYVAAFIKPGERALCATLQMVNGTVIFPFILRPIEEAPLVGLQTGSDIISPYGYGGAFIWGSSDSGAERFWVGFGEWARAAGVVSTFVRMSLFPEETLAFPAEIQDAKINVVRALQLSGDELWMSYEHKVRKNVNKARSLGVTVECDVVGKHLGDFMDIYLETMARRGANADFLFKPAIFNDLFDQLNGNVALFTAYHKSIPVSTEMVLLSTSHAYSFLGGTRESAFSLRPNDLLKHEIIVWARHSGRSDYVLGGGLEEGDGIFRYKLTFAPNGKTSFRVGRWIHLPGDYERLVEARRAALSNDVFRFQADHFPAYR